MPLSETEQRVAAAVEARAPALLEDLRLHVGLPTGHNNTAAFEETRQRLTERLTALGATHERVAGEPRPDWLLGGGTAVTIPDSSVCRRTIEGKPRVLIAGHMDTVHDPHGPFRELTVSPDGKTATGPGCVDMKGGLVIAVAALEALAECGVDTGWSFFLNADEETGTYHSETALRAESAKHDWGLALEPALAGGELAVERMGSGQFCIECFGRSAHVGRAFTQGVSAVTALAERLVKVAQIADPDAGRIVSVGPLRGGDATNAVPDHALAWGNARYPTKAVGDAIAAQLDALATPDDAMPRVVVHRSFKRPAKPLIPETERLALGARDVAEALDQRLPFASTGGVCDGNIMQDTGLPTIDTLGVRGGGLHTPDEWIELASLVERCQLLAVLVCRLSSGGVQREGA